MRWDQNNFAMHVGGIKTEERVRIIAVLHSARGCYGEANWGRGHPQNQSIKEKIFLNSSERMPAR